MTKEAIEPGEEETVTSDVLAAWLGLGAYLKVNFWRKIAGLNQRKNMDKLTK